MRSISICGRLGTARAARSRFETPSRPASGIVPDSRQPVPARAAASIAVIRQLRDEFHARCGLPRTLQETGKVAREQFAAVVGFAIDDGAIIFNSAEADRAELLAVLERACA